jgi:hypothetical protein
MEMYRGRNIFRSPLGWLAVPTLNNAASTASQLVLMYGCRRKGVKALKTYHHRRARRGRQRHRRASLRISSSRSLGFMHKKLLLAEENKFRVVRVQFYYAW